MNSSTFWKKLFFFFLCLILVDCIVGNVLSYLYFKQKKGKLYNITLALEKQTCEALIFGSSRAMHHYNPEIITDSLGLSCFNAGYDGQGILYCNGVFDVILERYTPKIIILDINPYEFSESSASYDLLYVLNPYVKRHPVLWNTLSLKSNAENIKHLSSIYPYNSMFARIIMGNISLIETKDMSNNGFTAQEGIWTDAVEPEIYLPTVLDINKINAFDSFCRKCLENDIKLYITISPMYKIVENTSPTIDYLVQKCATLNIPFINYTNDENYTNNELFLDPDHLNILGSELFSKDISHRIILSLHHKNSM